MLQHYSGIIESSDPVNGSGLYFTLRGTVYLPGDTISITDVGDGYLTECMNDNQFDPVSSLVCVTSNVNTNCCRDRDHPGNGSVGNWLYPNGAIVIGNSANSNGDFTRSSHTQQIRLNRKRANVMSPTGVYTCQVPDGYNFSTHTANITIGKNYTEPYFILCMNAEATIIANSYLRIPKSVWHKIILPISALYNLAAISKTTTSSVTRKTTSMSVSSSFIATSTAMDTTASSSTAMDITASSSTAMDTPATSSTAMDTPATSRTAMNTPVTSSIAMDTPASSSTAMDIIASSTVTDITATSIAMTTSTAMDTIASSLALHTTASVSPTQPRVTPITSGGRDNSTASSNSGLITGVGVAVGVAMVLLLMVALILAVMK